VDKPDAIDPLQAAILAIMASCDRPLTLEEIAAELGRLAIEGQRIALGERERGH
jgi:hypothetical protein